MTSDLALPGSVLAFKALSRLFAGQKPDRVDFIKAALAFPTDAIFLSFSFTAAVLYSTKNVSDLPGKGVVPFIVVCAVCCFGSAVLSRYADDAFDEDKTAIVLWTTFVNYFIALATIASSLSIGSFL